MPQSTLTDDKDAFLQSACLLIDLMTEMISTMNRILSNYEDVSHDYAKIKLTLQRIEAKIDASNQFAKEEKI